MSNNKPTYQDLENLNIKLKQSKNRFNLLLKASDDMVTIHEPNGKYIYYNGPTCYPITSKDIVGKMPNELFDADTANTLLNTFEKVKKTGKSKTIEVLLDWLGEKKWFSEYVYPIKNASGQVVELVKVCRDIHKRKVAEQEIETKNKVLTERKKELDFQNDKLYQLNNTLNLAQKLSHVGSWHWDIANDTAEWSDEMYNIYGVTKDNFYPSNSNVTKTVLPEDLHKIEQGIGKLMNDETFIPFEFRIKRPSGEIRNLYIIALERKSPNSIFGVTKDITERKQIEAKNLLLKENYRELFENATISIWNEDLSLVFEQIDELRKLSIPNFKIYLEENPKVLLSLLQNVKVNNVNNATLALFKAKTKKEFLEKYHTTFGKGAKKVFRNLIEAIWNNNKTFESEVNYKTLDGEEFTCLFSVPIPQTKQKQKAVPISIQSIQKIKDAKSEIKESLSKLNQAQKLSHVGNWQRNLVTGRTEWSDEMYRIFGVNKDSFSPNVENVNKTVLPEDLPLLEQAISSLLNNEKIIPFEIRIERPSGEIRNLYILALEKKSNDCIFGVTKDITEQKRFEDAQIKNQRLKAIGEMSSSIAHDFNNSLQQMMGNLEVLKNQNDLSDTTFERLNNITSIIDNISGRVSALQKFGDTKHDNKNTKLIDFNSLIEESLKESRPLWKDSMEKEGLKVIVTTEFQKIPKIRCVIGELKSAIYNLIKNSIEAMPKGGELTIKTGVTGTTVFATFTDTGIGMNEDTKLKIFQPFFSTKGFKLGRGLGLSGVYSTLKTHHGDIVVTSSELDKGTTFEVTFPISEQEIEVVETVKKIESKTNKSYNILWVDDDPMITESASELVELIGHNCNIENSAKNALEYLNKNSCDIVFTDIGMPDMNGWELADAIRSKFGDKIKIVIVSGWAVENKLKTQHNIDYALQKPFTFKALEEIFSDE
jgi:PAS domain S-box-containing protein